MGSDVYHIATNDGSELPLLSCIYMSSESHFIFCISFFLVTSENTLHGGLYGWDRRSWTIIAKTDTSVTYYHLDKGDEGFPGNVSAYVRSLPSLLSQSTSPFMGRVRLITQYVVR